MEVGGWGGTPECFNSVEEDVSWASGDRTFLWYRSGKLSLLRQDDLCRVRSSTHVLCEFTAVSLKPLQSVKLAVIR